MNQQPDLATLALEAVILTPIAGAVLAGAYLALRAILDKRNSTAAPVDVPAGRWVPIPPAHLGDDLDEWVETCPRDRRDLLEDDTDTHAHAWEWVAYSTDETRPQ